MAGKQIVGASSSGGEGIDWNDYLGKLTLVEPLGHEHDIKTKHGESDAIRANVYVLLGPGKVEEFEDVLIFQRKMIGQLKRRIGSIVVGRIGQGENVKGNPPWLFEEANETDIGRATAFWNSHTIGSATTDKPAAKKTAPPKSKAPEPDADEGWGDDGTTDEGEAY